MFTRSILPFAFLFCLLAFGTVAAGETPPPWLRTAASVTTPGYEKNVPAVVLHAEQHVTLGADGRLVTVENYAVRMLNDEGRNYAIARAFYLVSSGKVREIEGWMIRSNGTSKSYDKKTVLDVIADQDDVYNEGRLKVINASRDVEAGHVFGYTVISEDTPLFYQDNWNFQSMLPTMMSRYSLTLPSGWRASSVTFNTAEVKPQVNGSTYVWELRNLPPIASEPMSPSVMNMVPRIAVNYAPENGAGGVNRTFSDWLDVSRWATALNEPQVVVDDDVAAKARDLTVNATTELEKIQALAGFVQNLQYISIDIGVGHGNGYKPRPSNLVLSRGYGDCKDKANLMRAMLRVLKIEAYPVVIFAGDPTFVREQWPSPRQFNHCIIAVKVGDSTLGPTIINHEKLGRLLIFDATDPHTSVGDLPEHLQGSLALVVAGDNGSLSRMPVTPPETDLVERNITVDLNNIGAISGTIREIANGQASTAMRREYRGSSASDYRKTIEQWLTTGATGAKVDALQSKDGPYNANFETEVTFSADRYAQLMQGRMLVFKPVVVSRRHGIYLTDSKRANPIRIRSSSMTETAVFTLPVGFEVDDVPDNVDLETAIGNYKTHYEVKEGKLHFTRQLTMNRIVMPVDKYSVAKDFFSKIRDAEQSSVVLIKK